MSVVVHYAPTPAPRRFGRTSVCKVQNCQTEGGTRYADRPVYSSRPARVTCKRCQLSREFADARGRSPWLRAALAKVQAPCLPLVVDRPCPCGDGTCIECRLEAAGDRIDYEAPARAAREEERQRLALGRVA